MNSELYNEYSNWDFNINISYEEFLESNLINSRIITRNLLDSRRWLRWPDNEPVPGEMYWVLRRCPDGWDYQIATYDKFRGDKGWFSEILAKPLRYVTHYKELTDPPEIIVSE